MMRKKLRCRRGLTLTETLTALGIFAIFSVVLMYGVTAAWKVYSKAVVASEARTLQSTLNQALSDELRYAENIRTVDGKVVYDSEVFGAEVSVTVSSEGRIQIGVEESPKDLLGEKTYTSGLKVKEDAKIAYDETKGVFTVELTITQEAFLKDGIKTTLTIQALNAPASAG